MGMRLRTAFGLDVIYLAFIRLQVLFAVNAQAALVPMQCQLHCGLDGAEVDAIEIRGSGVRVSLAVIAKREGRLAML